MNQKEAQRIVDEALAAAKADQSSLLGGDNQKYLIALAAAVVAYFVLQQLKPAFVLKRDEVTGELVVCQMRLIGSAVVVGLAALAAQHYM